MTEDDRKQLQNLFRDRVNSPPQPWGRIRGTHLSSTKKEEVDFDIKAKAWFPRLLRLESDVSGFEAIEISATGNIASLETVDNEKVGKCLRAISASAGTGVNDSTCSTSGQALVSEKVQKAAKMVAYAGRVEVTFRDTSSSEVVQETSPTKDHFLVAATWSFQWQGLRDPGSMDIATPDGRCRWLQMEWAGRIGHAMADGIVGWVGKDDVVGPGAPFLRVVREKNLANDVADGERGDGVIPSRFQLWSHDE